MRRSNNFLCAALLLVTSVSAFATVFANVHGVVHDAQHRPIAEADVTLQAADSDFVITGKTNNDGEFDLRQAPIGVYKLTIAATGFATMQQTLTIASGTTQFSISRLLWLPRRRLLSCMRWTVLHPPPTP